ncbi:hypothetical protein [Streptomyces coeruleofuscus]|uniref:DUF5667 domain-containing protein n=1 Tax=Streptomyces coeruleofuscus TaxID=66879 RepID=A0ABN3I6N2_9ACTN
MPARNDDGRRDADYDGMDALMAALVDDPLPEGARRDPAFMTAHRAAMADVAQLRDQLLLLGDTLARDAGADVAGAEGEPGAGSEAGARARGEAGPAAGPHAEGPGAAVDPPVRELPVGPRATGGRPGQRSGAGSSSGRRSRPRPLVVVLRGLAAAAAATVVVGMGWLVVQGGSGSGQDSGSGSDSAADSAAGSRQGVQESGPGRAGYLACARLVAEGTVAEVEPVPGTGQDRVTLDVDRYYKPAKGQDRVVFPMDEDAAPQPQPGERVLLGITRGQAQPDLWKAGEKEIAPERARIAAALPESGTLPCE